MALKYSFGLAVKCFRVQQRAYLCLRELPHYSNSSERGFKASALLSIRLFFSLSCFCGPSILSCIHM